MILIWSLIPWWNLKVFCDRERSQNGLDRIKYPFESTEYKIAMQHYHTRKIEQTTRWTAQRWRG